MLGNASIGIRRPRSCSSDEAKALQEKGWLAARGHRTPHAERGAFTLSRGWFPIRRSILKDPHWLEGLFTKGQAKLDLALLAEYEDTEATAKGGKKIPLRRGQLFTSIRWLADRWGWHRNTVKRFLDLLAENEEDLYAIERETVNASKFNPKENPEALGIKITFINYSVLHDTQLSLPEDMK